MTDPTQLRISSLRLINFKSFENYTIYLDRVNILVGPNNSGKSTIIGALRTLAIGLRIARARSPERIQNKSFSGAGYSIPSETLPISLENVHTNYGSLDSEIVFTLNNYSKLRLLFPNEGGCFLVPEVKGTYIRSPSVFKKHFPITLAVVPILGPVEHKEMRREKTTVIDALSTHRASRHFRSYWYYFEDGFDEFSSLIKSSWPSMEICKPELNRYTDELTMFCLEDRISRELYWVGFGFQIWCQLLTHLCRVKHHSMIIVDEPEIYLHPDIQRQLLGILRDTGPDVMLATHSSEIMSEADPSEIILVDKKKTTGERLKDISGVQKALGAVGSIQNITLSTLARNRRVLFVEGGDDFRLLRRLARKFGLIELGAGLGVTPLESEGFSSWQRISTLAEGISSALGANLRIAAIYDRDYFCDEEVEHVRSESCKSLKIAHIHQRKEIENYLLVPDAIDRALAKLAAEGKIREGQTIPNTTNLLEAITAPLRDEIHAQFIGKRLQYFKSSKKDPSTLTMEATTGFNSKWKDLSTRILIVSGKQVLAELRSRLQETFTASLTDARIIEVMRKEDFPLDLINLLEQLNEFRKAAI